MVSQFLNLTFDQQEGLIPILLRSLVLQKVHQLGRDSFNATIFISTMQYGFRSCNFRISSLVSRRASTDALFFALFFSPVNKVWQKRKKKCSAAVRAVMITMIRITTASTVKSHCWKSEGRTPFASILC